jgi:polyisoprenoid-binding protein YceI
LRLIEQQNLALREEASHENQILGHGGCCLRVCVAVRAQDKPAGSPRFKVDHNHSTIGLEVPIMGGLSKAPGKFTDFDVAVVYDPDDITKSSVNAMIHVASVDTGIAGRDEDLRSDNFVNVAKFPTITFVSHSIEQKEGKIVAHGTLTMKGLAKEIDLPISLAGEFPIPNSDKKIIGFHASMKLNRCDYGITWEHQALATFVGDEVTVNIDVIN